MPNRARPIRALAPRQLEGAAQGLRSPRGTPQGLVRVRGPASGPQRALRATASKRRFRQCATPCSTDTSGSAAQPPPSSPHAAARGPSGCATRAGTQPSGRGSSRGVQVDAVDPPGRGEKRSFGGNPAFPPRGGCSVSGRKARKGGAQPPSRNTVQRCFLPRSVAESPVRAVSTPSPDRRSTQSGATLAEAAGPSLCRQGSQCISCGIAPHHGRPKAAVRSPARFLRKRTGNAPTRTPPTNSAARCSPRRWEW